MSAPERVYLSGIGSYQGWSLTCCDDCPAYVPESRALAAEQERDAAIVARDHYRRERAALRAERDYLAVCLGEANASKETAHEEVARIRAEDERVLDAYKVALQDIERTSLEGGNDSPTMVVRKDRAKAARAAVLARMQSQGEMMEVTEGNFEGCPIIAVPEDYNPGQWVRVVKVEPDTSGEP